MSESPDTRWTIYGRVKTGLDPRGVVQFHGLHFDRLHSLELANAFVDDAIARYGKGAVECVIVELRHGDDTPATRRVIRRVNDAQSWFE